MSGTFENINVPHTLVSFAVTHDEAENVQSGSFKKSGNHLYLVMVPYSAELAPDWEVFKKNSDTLYELNKAGKISAMYPVGAGGIAEAVTKMSFGNRIGAQITAIPSSATAIGFHRNVNNTIADLFTPLYGSIIVETEDDKFENNSGFVNTTVVKIGNTQKEEKISIAMSGLNPLPLMQYRGRWRWIPDERFPVLPDLSVPKELRRYVSFFRIFQNIFSHFRMESDPGPGGQLHFLRCNN
mgnify:CR=1 FL=1